VQFIAKFLGLLLACFASAHADEVQVAVAANFSAPMHKLALAFERETGHKAVISVGSTGKFYAQIRNGAPFAVLLSADDETPTRLAQEGLALASTQFTYAKGQLVLWSARPDVVDAQGQVLQGKLPGRLALADPKLAPYGLAATEALAKLGLSDRLKPNLIVAENIVQTYQFVKTGNAALGFVALSQVMSDGRLSSGSAWVLPASLYSPIRQDAIVLKAAEHQPAARALMAYLRSDSARQLMASYGYLN
jgi:molybdate transport system substrate-binding protein